MSTITLVSTSPFSFSVRPVETRSTIRLDKPSVGASSIAPFSLTTSACTTLFFRSASRVRFRVLACDAQVARCIRAAASRWLCDRQPAVPDIEIDRRIEIRIGEFLNHVRTDDTDLSGAVGDERCDIECAHADDPHFRAIAAKRQRSRLLVMELRIGHHARAQPSTAALHRGCAPWVPRRSGSLACTSDIAGAHYVAHEAKGNK